MKKAELNKIAPTLSSIPRESHLFSVPQGYFEGVEDSVLSKSNPQLDLEKLKSNNFAVPKNYFETLEDLVLVKMKAEIINKNTNQDIPEDYFETLEDKIIAKIKSKPQKTTIRRISKFIFPVVAAASLLLIFVLNSNNDITFDSLTTSEIESFIYDGNVDIDQQNLELAFSDIELDINTIDSGIEAEDIYNYLSNEELDDIIYDN